MNIKKWIPMMLAVGGLAMVVAGCAAFGPKPLNTSPYFQKEKTAGCQSCPSGRIPLDGERSYTVCFRTCAGQRDPSSRAGFTGQSLCLLRGVFSSIRAKGGHPARRGGGDPRSASWTSTSLCSFGSFLPQKSACERSWHPELCNISSSGKVDRFNPVAFSPTSFHFSHGGDFKLIILNHENTRSPLLTTGGGSTMLRRRASSLLIREDGPFPQDFFLLGYDILGKNRNVFIGDLNIIRLNLVVLFQKVPGRSGHRHRYLRGR